MGAGVTLIAADELPAKHPVRAVGHCRLCPHTIGYLARYVHADRRTTIRWVCDRCEDYKTGDLPHSFLEPRGLVIHDLPKRVDRTHEEILLPGCDLCATKPAHFHHWSPVSIFPDWPGDMGAYLCERHHEEWHDRMRAHGLRYPHETRT